MKIKLIFALAIMLLAFLACRDGDVQGNYPVKIEKKNGVTNIKNPERSMKGTREVILKEELSIGGEADEAFILVRPRTLAIDDQENFYILDVHLNMVRVFDRNGEHIRDMGKEGQGPGEFLSPIDLKLDGDNKMCHILDSRRNAIIRYRFDGTYDSEFRLKESYAVYFYLDAQKNYIVFNTVWDENEAENKRITRYSAQGELMMKSNYFLTVKEEMKEAKGWTFSMPTPFDPMSLFTCDAKGFIYYGFSDLYEIHVLDVTFKEIKILYRHFPGLIKVTSEEREGFFNRLKEKEKKKGKPYFSLFIKSRELPVYHPIFMDIWTDDRGRLLVRISSTDGKVHLDIFNTDGIYEERLIMKYPSDNISLQRAFYAPIFKDDCVYCVVIDRDGVNFVKKFKLIEKLRSKND